MFTRILAGNGHFVTGSAAGNTGSGFINPGSVTAPASLTGHDYRIDFSTTSGTTRYDVVDINTGSTLLSAQPYTSGQSIRFDGMDIVVEGAPAGGDSFMLPPAPTRASSPPCRT